MIFLIAYDRRCGEIVRLRQFDNSDRAEAAKARLELELRRHQEDLEREIVLLEAASETALRETHRR